jgi:hypothetical protein
MLFPLPPAVRPINRAAGAHPLLQGLSSYWSLGEASGNRADSKGSNTLTSNNGVTSTTGKVGNAASFAMASTQYLSAAHASSLSPGNTSYTYAGWFRFTTISSVQRLVSKSGTSKREYEFYLNADNKVYFDVYDGTTNGTSRQATSAGALSATTWYFIVFGYNATTNKIYIQVNNGTEDTVTPSFTPGTNNAAWGLGARSQLDPGQYFNGDCDELGLWSRVLTAGERTTLYNGGAGLGIASF